jgi:DNA-binding NarL/FixJ family response regulator
VPDRIAIILLDNDLPARRRVASLLSAQPGFLVVETSADFGVALQRVQETAPDVILLNLSARDSSCLGFIGAVRREAPRARVIVMGMLLRHEDLTSLIRAGVTGFLMAEAPLPRILATIRSVAEDIPVLPSELTHSLFLQLADRAGGSRPPSTRSAVGPVEIVICQVPAA